tara:strand:+ start:11030 stop:11386 length:357 start_codon:yes stop_codon:yes gene_type:complete
MIDDKNKIPEDLTASISFYLDEDDMVWVSAEWTETEEGLDSFAEFMFKLNSGLMLSDCLDFLRQECTKVGKMGLYKDFIIKLNDHYDEADFSGDLKDSEPKKERPVVRPTKVKPSLGY